jgi:hypothetical protein
VQDCIAMARRVHGIVRENAPRARFVVNQWAVAEWDGFPTPFGLEFWQKQVLLSKALVREENFLGPDCGIVFSMDNYYRSLTLSCYSDADLQPDLFPLASDVSALHERGVARVLGWPYFLVDEIDDGFIRPNNVASGGQSQAETRYIRAVTDVGRSIGLDGMVTNAAFVDAEALNIYVFARMCHAPELTPEAALDEYAAIVADDASSDVLAQVLRFIENHSNWQNSLPEEYRLPNFDCGDLTSPSVAIERLQTVTPRDNPPIPLPEPPAAYLERLKKRLEKIEAGEIGGFAPIVRTGEGK